ncbi:uncharacterized protein [Aquarana catesbeiana]|uniref:uncharacterized protein n=1 Tax=Aquarana catesbeiana TaxID=8400 RepID=UPI003CCA0468
MAVQRLTVGIFSRDGQENYKWLINLLRTAMFQSLVEYVLNVYITNNVQIFTEALKECSFAILYHTKKRGRLNIANVQDSLYDEELRDLNDQLGDNVVVLVDDIDDSSDSNKRRILGEQPLIRDCAQELILISELEKQAANLTGSDPRWSPAPISPAMQDAYDSIHNKIYRIRTFMEDAMGGTPDRRAQNSSYAGSRAPNDSDSDTQSEGYKSSATTKSASYRYQDVESIRSSSAYSSDRSSRPLYNSQRSAQRDGFPAIHEETHIPLHGDGGIPEDGDQPHNRGQKTRSLGTSLTCCKNLSDKTVFFIIGGLVAILLIILIVILSVAL